MGLNASRKLNSLEQSELHDCRVTIYTGWLYNCLVERPELISELVELPPHYRDLVVNVIVGRRPKSERKAAKTALLNALNDYVDYP